MADLKESQALSNQKAEEFEIFQDDDEFEEFEEDWGKNEEEKDDTLWDADWDDADVTDDFAKQLRAELDRTGAGRS
jgi:26 proteasome complex subunit DSS1